MIEILSGGPLVRIGRALEERLKLAFPPAMFEHGFVPAKLSKGEWEQLTRRTPFVGLGWNEVEPDKDSGRLLTGDTRWTVFLVNRNAGSIGGRYFGDSLAQGLFHMVQAAMALLHGHTVDGLGTFMVTKAGNLYADQWETGQMAIAAVDVDMRLALPMRSSILLTDLELAKTLLTEWKFQATPSPLDNTIAEPAPAIIETETLEAA